jgi:hypothetical protein
MRAWLRTLLFACCGFALPASAGELASYNFDSDLLDSGPDTYQVFRKLQEKAKISQTFASSGYASAHLSDQAGDKEFVEFLSYFEEQRSGVIRFRASFLIVDGSTILNMALAGKDGFIASSSGIGFWLFYRDGWLRHVSDSIPKKAVMLNAMEWYTADAVIDLDNSLYHLRIIDEQGKTLFGAADQPMASGAAPQHSINMFSITGDIADLLPSDFYLDDLIITTDNNTKAKPFVAPGRRQFFVEQWQGIYRQVQGKLRCLPARDLEDFGIDVDTFSRLTDDGKLDLLFDMTRPDADLRRIRGWEETDELIAIAAWQQGCDALENGEVASARSLLERAAQLQPKAYIFQLNRLIAQAKKGNYPELSGQIWSLPHRASDIRSSLALAMLAFHAGDHESAASAASSQVRDALAHLKTSQVDGLRRLGVRQTNRDYIQEMQRYMPQEWKESLQWLVAIEQHYYAALWIGNSSEAYEIATAMTEKLRSHKIKPGIWIERQGDAAFFMGNTQLALQHYQSMGRPEQLGSSVKQKMSDAYHQLGNREEEKRLRELFYKGFAQEP